LVKNVKVENIQADEIWSYIAMKDKTKIEKDIHDARIGSAYTFTCIDVQSKLIVGWHLGRRTEQDATIFLEKVARAVEGGTKRFQITTDAFAGYTHTVTEVLGTMADYAQLHKNYRATRPDDARYSPADCIGCSKRVIVGRPDEAKISTSHVERHNLTMRMSMRRFTRLTNGFSKKWENLNYMLAIFFVFYNFCRAHKSLDGATPAMAANLSKSFWTLKDLLLAVTDI
jgi:IS1 family transposase